MTTPAGTVIDDSRPETRTSRWAALAADVAAGRVLPTRTGTGLDGVNTWDWAAQAMPAPSSAATRTHRATISGHLRRAIRLVGVGRRVVGGAADAAAPGQAQLGQVGHRLGAGPARPGAPGAR